MISLFSPLDHSIYRVYSFCPTLYLALYAPFCPTIYAILVPSPQRMYPSTARNNDHVVSLWFIGYRKGQVDGMS